MQHKRSHIFCSYINASFTLGRYKTEHDSSQEDLGAEEETGPETFLELDTLDLFQPFTSPGPNLEQKVPSELPNLQATESLTPLVCLRYSLMWAGLIGWETCWLGNLKYLCNCGVGFREIV